MDFAYIAQYLSDINANATWSLLLSCGLSTLVSFLVGWRLSKSFDPEWYTYQGFTTEGVDANTMVQPKEFQATVSGVIFKMPTQS